MGNACASQRSSLWRVERLGRFVAVVLAASACESLLGFERGVPVGATPTNADAGAPTHSGTGGAPTHGGTGGAIASPASEMAAAGVTGGDGNASGGGGCSGDGCAGAEPECEPTPETCDGLDNDCNGAADFADSNAHFELSGASQKLADSFDTLPGIVFSPENSAYGVIFRAGAWQSPTLRFQRLDLDGSELGAPTILEPQGVQSHELVAGDGKFGVVWEDAGGNVYLQLLSGEGKAEDLVLLSEEPAAGSVARLVYTANVGWTAFWTSYDGVLVGRTRSQAGTLGKVLPVLTSNSVLDVTAARSSDSAILISYTDVAGEPLGALLSTSLFEQRSLSSLAGVLALGKRGFGVVFRDADAVSTFREISPQGDARCGPVVIDGIPSDVVANGDGYLIVTTTGVIDIARDCELRQTAAAMFGSSGGRVASSGARGFTVVWSEKQTEIWRRSFGPHLCD